MMIFLSPQVYPGQVVWCSYLWYVVLGSARTLNKGLTMKALITGGAGFIGSNIAGMLLDMGHEPVILDNLLSGYEMNILPGARFVKGDIRNMDDIEAAVDGCDVIFNLAASVGNKRSIDNPIEDSEINVMGTLKVLEVARRHDIKKVVHSSSAGIFGELKQLPITEDHPQDPNSPYGVSKLASEKHCLLFNDLYGMDNVCLRYFNVYGINQRYDAYGNVIPIFAMRLLSGMPLLIYGDGYQTRDFINVQDVARANIMCALAEDVRGVFNLDVAMQYQSTRLLI